MVTDSATVTMETTIALSIGTADPLRPHLPPNGGSNMPQDGGRPPSWKILNGCIAAKGHAIHFMLRFYGRVFGLSGTNGVISGYIKPKLAAGRHLG